MSKKTENKQECFDLSLLLKSYEDLPEFEFDFTLEDYDFDLHLEDYDFDYFNKGEYKMKAEDFNLVKKFFDRLTAEDFQRRAEDKVQANKMMFAFNELLEEVKKHLESPSDS